MDVGLQDNNDRKNLGKCSLVLLLGHPLLESGCAWAPGGRTAILTALSELGLGLGPVLSGVRNLSVVLGDGEAFPNTLGCGSGCHWRH